MENSSKQTDPNANMREIYKYSDNPWPKDLPDCRPKELNFADWIASLPPEKQKSYEAWVTRNHDRITRQLREQRSDVIFQFVGLLLVVLLIYGAISLIGLFFGEGGGLGDEYWPRRR